MPNDLMYRTFLVKQGRKEIELKRGGTRGAHTCQDFTSCCHHYLLARF